VSAFWASGNLDGYFKGAPKVIVPWPSAGRRKNERRIPEPEVHQLIAGPARLHEVDPLTLFATQPWVLRTHAAYYLTGEWEITGRTSADMHSIANRYPTFVERRGQLVIATGHHRSLAALIEGRAVLARIVSADPQPIAITPHLAISDHEESSGHDVVVLVDRLLAGQRVTVSSDAVAVDVLRRVGLDEHEVADRMHRAGRRVQKTSAIQCASEGLEGSKGRPATAVGARADPPVWPTPQAGRS